ncbi:MAG: DUF2625 domain-containing protein [Verrucomicrobia bacterium]|nr:DUF2625 domain-containing protein [Verrucomicrobiota bacterium]
MKTLQELINREDPAWPLVRQWIAEAANPVEILPPPDDATRERALINTQVTTRSPMGAITYESGGILIDHGWLRILAAGHPRLPRSLPGWNSDRSFTVSGQRPSFLLIADDVVGGFFAIDGGGLGFERGKVCYLPPDTLTWENTEKGYSDFLVWCFKGDLATYYEAMRWGSWQKDLETVGGDEVFGFLPPLCIGDSPVAKRGRELISVSKIYELHVAQSNK